MFNFNEPSSEFKEPQNFRNIMMGTTFELSSELYNEDELDAEIELTDAFDEEEIAKYRNPCNSTTEDLRQGMEKLSDYIYKKVLKPSKSTNKIDIHRNRVTYHYNFYLEKKSQPFDSTYLRDRPAIMWMSMSRQGCALEGIQLALSSMCINEEALFVISHEKAFGKLGCSPRIPPEADIIAEISIIQIEEMGSDKISEELLNNKLNQKTFKNTMDIANEVFINAKACFARKNLTQSIKLYQKIIQILEYQTTLSDKEKEDSKELQIRAIKNLIVCLNKKEQPHRVLEQIKSLEELIDIKNNPKMLYHKGKAHMMNGNFREARENYVAALKIVPHDTDLLNEMKKLEKKIHDHKLFEKELAQKINI